MPSATAACSRASRQATAKPHPPVHAFYNSNSEPPATISSGNTTPTPTGSSGVSSDAEEDFTTTVTTLLHGVQCEVAVAPSRFGFEYEQYFVPPTDIPNGRHARGVAMSSILLMSDIETRRTCRVLRKSIKGSIDATLFIKPSPISYAKNKDIVHRILDFAGHEMRITSRRLCRSIKERLDSQLAASVVFTGLAVEEELGLHIAAVGQRRIPGLPPQSYDTWDSWKPGRAYTNPAILRHTRTLTLAGNLSNIVIGSQTVDNINIGLLAPHLNVHTVRDLHPGSNWNNPVSCTKYVTLTLLNGRHYVRVPRIPDGVLERVINISCPRDRRTRYRSVLYSLGLPLSNRVRRVVIILRFPPILTAAHFHDLALDPPLGVLSRVAEEIFRSPGVYFTIVGAEAAPPTVLGFETRDPLPPSELHYELYQRMLPFNHSFLQYTRLKERVRFMSLAEYRAQVGEKRFQEDLIPGP
ncbi:hypothetical protein CspeluHIS016_0901890 [Cutaneotrichosporon spelunceum]|uniref:Uncharacterized protein n=1 Tax=Cutaneotrichosporon spelunceum TaxID=1672016 RepID=A0AAD3U029_9TREE|nr:hypothetical protein CspeluHIS016_0901890 [Cutaneotrichosporon spelunceum]